MSAGTTELTAAGDIALAGPVSAASVEVSTSGGSLSAATITSGSGSVSLQAADAVTLSGPVQSASELSIVTQGGIRQSASANIASAGTTELTAAGDIALAGPVSAASVEVSTSGGSLSAVDVTAQGSVALSASGSVNLTGDVTTRGALTLTSQAASVEQVSGRLNVGSAAVQAAADIRLTAQDNSFADVVSLTGANVAISSSGDLRIGAVSASQSANFVSQTTLDLQGDIAAAAVTARSITSDIRVGNVSSSGALQLEAEQAVFLEGTIDVQSSLDITAGIAVSQAEGSTLSVKTGPSILTVLEGDVDLIDRSKLAGLEIDDDRMRLARSGGTTGPIRDYIPVSNSLTALPVNTSAAVAPAVVSGSTNVEVPTQLPAAAASAVPAEPAMRDIADVEAVSIGPTGKVFKMVSNEEAASISETETTAEVSNNNQEDEVSVSIRPEFLDKGQVLVVEGGIATPDMLAASNILDNGMEDPAGLATDVGNEKMAMVQ